MIFSVIGGAIIANVWFISINIPFFLLDLFQPKWAMEYKIQDDKLPTLDKYVSSLKRILPNLLFFGPLTAFLLYPFTSASSYDPYNLPALSTIPFHLVLYLVVEEIGFYYSHRLFHHKALYKHIHKIHHEWTAPVSISAVYCHPIEHMLSNSLPILLGPVLLGSHVLVGWFWICLALTSTTSSHSGYHFPLQPAPQFHDYHHKVFNENFGVLGILDNFHGTDKTFKASIFSRRNRMFPLGNVKRMYVEKE